jgi:isoleucyl-tRNA synthetase
MSTADFRRACRAYAEKYVDIQRRDFKRLGILGTWDDPVQDAEVRIPGGDRRALGKFVEQDMVYKGKKPVHWCTHCRTALAKRKSSTSRTPRPRSTSSSAERRKPG